MAAEAEVAFVKTYLNTLSSQPIRYADDYQQPPSNSLPRVPVLPIALPPVPQRKSAGSISTESISVTFKSAKPPASYTLSVSPTDTISVIKAQIASVDNAPPADAQRLLLKGKALSDAKLLKEYSIKDGDVVNLMVKPGFDWDPAGVSSKPVSSSTSTTINMQRPPSLPVEPISGVKRDTPAATLSPEARSPPPKKRHQRIPSVVLSPSASADTPGLEEKPVDIVLPLDDATGLSTTPDEPISSYHATVAKPEFWSRLLVFLQTEFASEADTRLAFEDFLRACKGSLTAHQIAKIRDHVGVVGMAGR